MTDKIDLVELIKANPGCVAIIDNDSWRLFKHDPFENPHDEENGWDAYCAWEEANKIADDRSIKPLGDGGYGSDNRYGGDILQALAQIVGIKIESV